MERAFQTVSRLGVLGGTFDPPHNGHFSIAAEVASAKNLDRVLFVPAAQPWQKSQYSPAEDRFTMTVLGARCDPRFAVSRIELDRKGPTYTVETLLALGELCGPKVEFFFILGVDAAKGLTTWYRADDLARSAGFLAVTRPGFDASDLKLPTGGPPVEVVEVSPVDVSSTQIRAAVREGRSIDHLVPAEVADYISTRGLYATDAPHL
ncbi:MAG: nicotinate-nucleotide adenylyltransferase [Actinomycetota bacterium]|jgi:nicotinate-nucleotide adenylyltransferase|nr:nicotinate-nucleotide adenylyltransferase [Actinomycetota bacterium]